MIATRCSLAVCLAGSPGLAILAITCISKICATKHAPFGVSEKSVWGGEAGACVSRSNDAWLRLNGQCSIHGSASTVADRSARFHRELIS